MLQRGRRLRMVRNLLSLIENENDSGSSIYYPCNIIYLTCFL